MTYVEGASLHQDRGGSTVFARYAFNELWSFIAGWAMLLDYVILIAATRVQRDELPRRVLGAARRRAPSRSIACSAILGYVAVRNIRGFSTTRSSRIAAARRRRHRRSSC